VRRSLPAVLGVVVGAVVALALLLPGYVGLDRLTPFVQLAALTPMLLVVITGSVFVGRIAGVLVTRRRRGRPLDERYPRLFAFGFAAMVTAAVGALTAAGIVGSRLLADDPAPPGRPLTVLALNVDHGAADVGALAATVRARDPDVVVLPEAGDAYRARLAPLLPGYAGVSAPAVEDGGSTTLLTRPGVGTVDVVRGQLFGSLATTLPGGVRLLAVHTAAPVPGQVGAWQQDLADLVAPACRSGAPAVVVGDLNATTDQSAFRAASDGCVDALETLGAGTTATFPTNLPRWLGVQIDHVLTTGGVGVQDGEVLDVPGTDHRAVLTRLSLPG
jgi:endonuclease/exonuclease/phosphatase (EEP) superfamily protein YafD